MHDQNMAALRKQLVAALAAVDHMLGQPTAPGSEGAVVTLAAAAYDFKQQKKVEVSDQHYANVVRVLDRFLAHVMRSAGALRPEQVRPAIVLAYRTLLVEAGLTNKTVNHHMATLGCFFKWCITMQCCTDNPAKGMKLRIRGGAASERSALTRVEIGKLFGPTFFRISASWRARRWLPLIMLYTGARPEEVAQLRTRDIKTVGGVQVFDFACMDDEQRRKNESSRRMVPVHSRLLELAMNNALLNGRPEGMLFPELRAGPKGRLAESPSRWFNRMWLRQRAGITDPTKVLYSIRHSVATQLKVEHRTEEPLIAQLLGHANSSMTTGRYGKEYNLTILKGVVELLNWPVRPA